MYYNPTKITTTTWRIVNYFMFSVLYENSVRFDTIYKVFWIIKVVVVVVVVALSKLRILSYIVNAERNKENPVKDPDRSDRQNDKFHESTDKSTDIHRPDQQQQDNSIDGRPDIQTKGRTDRQTSWLRGLAKRKLTNWLIGKITQKFHTKKCSSLFV